MRGVEAIGLLIIYFLAAEVREEEEEDDADEWSADCADSSELYWGPGNSSESAVADQAPREDEESEASDGNDEDVVPDIFGLDSRPPSKPSVKKGALDAFLVPESK